MSTSFSRRRLITTTTAAIVAPSIISSIIAPKAMAQEETGHLNEADEWLADECGDMWPNQGAFETNIGMDMFVNYYFTYTRRALTALQCAAGDIEMWFVIGGFSESGDVQRLSTFTSTLPGGRKQSATRDSDGDTTLRYGRVSTAELEAGADYMVGLDLRGLRIDRGDNPWVAVQMGMITEGDGTIPLFLSRGMLGSVIYFNNGEANGYQWLPFGD